MREALKKKLQEKLKSNEGFTLLEILVVLTIMGFLIAMVGPRLAGMSGDAVDTVCDSNQNRMVTYISSYYEKTARFPSDLTNLVDQTAANTYQLPAISDQDPDNGPETVAAEFNDRNHFRLHVLNADEAKELKNMGIVGVLNLNAYDAYNDDGSAIKTGYDATAATGPNDVDLAAAVAKAPSYEKVTVAADLGVAMIGIGATAADGSAWDVETEERGWGEPEHIGRIVLGMGPESGLIKSGLITNAAHCPGGLQNADNATYNDYNVILPRLESTVAKYAAAVTGMDHDAAVDGVQVNAVAYDGSLNNGAAYDIAANADSLRYRTFDIAAVQEGWQYGTQCPEGHMYPEDDGEFWGVDLAGTANTID